MVSSSNISLFCGSSGLKFRYLRLSHPQIYTVIILCCHFERYLENYSIDAEFCLSSHFVYRNSCRTLHIYIKIFGIHTSSHSSLYNYPVMVPSCVSSYPVRISSLVGKLALIHVIVKS